MKQIVEILAKKAGDAKTASEALQYSQAATNVANAMERLFHIDKPSSGAAYKPSP